MGGKHCVTTTARSLTSQIPYDCSVGYPKVWASMKMMWCCKHWGIGCSDETETAVLAAKKFENFKQPFVLLNTKERTTIPDRMLHLFLLSLLVACVYVAFQRVRRRID